MESISTTKPGVAAAAQCYERSDMSNASVECISLLIRLCFDRDEAKALLSSLSGESGLEWLRVGVIYRRITSFASQGGDARIAIEQALAAKLRGVSPGLEGQPLGDLAAVWAKRRDELDALSAAGLLWYVARSPLPCWRRLEAHIIEDIQYLCVRALGRPAKDALPVDSSMAGSVPG